MKAKKPARELTAGEIMTKPVQTVRSKDPIHVVAVLFVRKKIGAAAVLGKNGNAIGVITKTDLVRYEEQREGFPCTSEEDTVEDWMTPVIFSVKPTTTVTEISERMIRYHIHHLFVQGKDGAPIAGIVSSFDVLRLVAARKTPLLAADVPGGPYGRN